MKVRRPQLTLRPRPAQATRAGPKPPPSVCCARVLQIRMDQLAAVLRGERRILNMPRDAMIAGAFAAKGLVGLRVHSEDYPPVPEGELLSVVSAITAKATDSY